MFKEKVLRELASIEASSPILSVYLDVDPKQRTSEEYRLTLREMLKNVDNEAAAADLEAVKHYIDLQYDWSGRGLAIFSCQAEDIWMTFPLSVPVDSGVTVAKKPYISPLVELNGLYGRYAVALVDRQGGHFYLFEMGDLVHHEGVMGEEIRHVRKGRGSSMVGMRGGDPSPGGRKEAELVSRNLKDVAEALTKFCNQYHPRRLLLGGAEHTVAQFQDVLPSPLKDMVNGVVSMSMDAGEVEVRDISLAKLQELHNQRQESLVAAVITAAAKGANGVIRLDETLSRAHEGRVQVLVLERDYHAPGYRCNGCDYLTTQHLETCPFCGEVFVEIPDAAEAVVTQVVEKGGTVEVVPDSMMGEAHIGALLRY
ncbi:MAG: hypothetical protein JW981_04875 [Anaerolineae bacterium]|nr:hypothetical protein [Anaerolineae bacterium]